MINKPCFLLYLMVDPSVSQAHNACCLLSVESSLSMNTACLCRFCVILRINGGLAHDSKGSLCSVACSTLRQISAH